MTAPTVTELIAMATHVKNGLAEENSISTANERDITAAIDRAEQGIKVLLGEVRAAIAIAFEDRRKVLTVMMGEPEPNRQAAE
jgi:hypothetical protein